jgi:hypothetical protein
MQPGSPNLSINLGKRNEQTTVSLFYKWVINTGKIIILGVEMLTLIALGYRFIIDRQIVDLNDQINKAQLFVNAQSKKENLYRNLQERINEIGKAEAATSTKVGFLKRLTSELNSSDFLTNTLDISDLAVGIEGQTYSIFSLNALIDTLKNDPDVISISIDQLTSLDQGIKFKLSIQLKS